MTHRIRAACAWAALASLPLPPAALRAQATAAVTSSAPKALYITILEGENELNDVRARTAREPIVQVEDENHKPVAGALVLFAIPHGGVEAANFSGLSSLSVRTDAEGKATAHGFHVTRHTGNFTIEVIATYAALQTAISIHQTNYVKGGKFANYTHNHPTLVTTIVGISAVAVAGTLIAIKAQPGATTITPGTGTVTGR